MLEFFVAEVAVRTTADLLDIQANTAVLFYHKIRLVIEYHLSFEAHYVFDGQIEADESYFGRHRKGKQGRGVAGKVAVFGLLKRQGKMFTVVVENTKSETLIPIMTREIKPDDPIPNSV